MPERRPNELTELGADELTSLVHDVRSCLHALRMGREVLMQTYRDEKLNDLWTAMEGEEHKASELLARLLKLVGRQEPPVDREG